MSQADKQDEREIIERPVGVTPHTIFAVVLATIVITASVVGTYLSVVWRLDSQAQRQVEIQAAIADLKATSIRDADMPWGAFALLNRDSVPAMRVPIPASVREGRIETFGGRP